MSTRRHLVVIALLALAACSREKTPQAYIEASEQHMAQGDVRGAEIELRNAVRLAPLNGTAVRLRGMARLALRQAGGAEADLRKALELKEPPEVVLPALARALAMQGKAEALVTQFASAPPLDRPAAEAEVRASLGDAYLSRREIDKAREQFTRARAAVADHVPARLGLVRVAAAEGRADAAKAELDALIATAPAQAEAHYLKSQLAAARGDRAAARLALQRTLEVDRQHVLATADLAALLADDRRAREAEALLDGPIAPLMATEPRLALLKAMLELQRGAVAEARARVAKILGAQPAHVGANVAAGQVELQDKHLAEAEKYLQAALGTARMLPVARHLLATTYLRQDRPAKAIEALQPLLEAGAPDARTLVLAGEASLASGDLAHAAEYLQRARAGGRDDPQGLYLLGKVAVLRGDHELGVASLESAAAADTGFAGAEVALALVHLDRKAFDKALAVADALAARQPRLALAPALAGLAQAGRKDEAAARQRFGQALALKADEAVALRGLAQLDVAAGKPADAVQRYEALIARQPNEALVLALADLQAGLPGDPDAALRTLAKGIAAQPDSAALTAGLVRLHLARRDSEAALAAAGQAATAHPRQRAFLDLLANTQTAAGRDADAVRTLRSLAEADPQATAPLLRLAAAQARTKDFAGAADSLRIARQLAPEDIGIVSDLAVAYASAGRHDRALDLARTLQSKLPQRAVGSILAGDIQASRQDVAQAEKAYRSALALEPASSVAAVKLFNLLQRARRGGDAAAVAGPWLAAHPNDAAMRMALADAAAAAGRTKEAVQHYERVLQREPSHVLALNNLAWVLGRANDPRALEPARRAAQLAPANPDVLDTLGVLQLRLGDPKEAVQTLGAARTLARDRPEVRLHFAQGLLRAQRLDEARAELLALAQVQADFDGKSEVAGLLGKLPAR